MLFVFSLTEDDLAFPVVRRAERDLLRIGPNGDALEILGDVKGVRFHFFTAEPAEVPVVHRHRDTKHRAADEHKAKGNEQPP